jgi:hypothetical protein
MGVMKCKVRLSHTVKMFVEGESEDAIQEWLLCTTPEEAVNIAFNAVDQEYEEEIICYVNDDFEVDYVIEDDEV